MCDLAMFEFAEESIIGIITSVEPIIHRENPRAKILRREARNKHIPDIPLPFNNMISEVSKKRNDEEYITNEKRDVIARDIRSTAKVQKIPTFTKVIPYKEFKSFNVFKRSLGEEKFKNLRIIDEAKAKSLFDDDEGDFLNHIKRDGIYFDTRHNRFLISAKAEDIKANHIRDVIEHQVKNQHIEAAAGKAITNKDKKLVKHHMKRDIHEYKQTTEKHHEPLQMKTKKDMVSKSKNTTSIGASSTTNVAAKMNQTHPKSVMGSLKSNDSKAVVKRSAVEDDSFPSNINRNIDVPKISKRNILPDDDPNIDYLMRYDGKNDQIVDLKKEKITREKQRANVKTAEKVYKFARSVMDLVGETEKRKDKRQVESTSLTGVWSGLGTQPEFVPGLIKRDYADSRNDAFSNAEKTISKRHVIKKISKEEGHRIILERKNRSKRQKGMWTGEHGFPVFKSNFQGYNTADNLKQKRHIETDDVSEIKNASDDEMSVISKRDIIPNEDEYEELVESVNGDAHDENKNQPKIRRDVKEQSESKQMELGSLGSINMAQHKTSKIIKRSTVIKTRLERIKNQKEKIVTKRSDHELGRNIAHITTSPVQDGRVVLAFDEVKELLPTKRFFSKDEEQLLEPVNEVQSRMTITKANEGSFDVDKDLVESMVLSGDNKRSNVLGLKATNIIYENNNEKLGSGRSKLIKNPSLLKSDEMLKKAQLSKVLTEEVQPKQDQMKKWINNRHDPAETETNKRIQEVSDQLAESNAELEKLKVINKAEEDSAYLAKKLEEKNTSNKDTPEIREEKFKKLQQEILDEQTTYRKLLEEQHRQYQEQINKEGSDLGRKENRTSNIIMEPTLGTDISKVNSNTMYSGLTGGSTMANVMNSNENNVSNADPKQGTTLETGASPFGTNADNLNANASVNNPTYNTPFQAVVQAPVPQQINFDHLDPNIGNYHEQIISTPQSLEHFERVHNPSLSNETFPEETTHEYPYHYNETTTTPKPATTLPQVTTTPPTITTKPPQTNFTSKATTKPTTTIAPTTTSPPPPPPTTTTTTTTSPIPTTRTTLAAIATTTVKTSASNFTTTPTTASTTLAPAPVEIPVPVISTITPVMNISTKLPTILKPETNGNGVVTPSVNTTKAGKPFSSINSSLSNISQEPISQIVIPQIVTNGQASQPQDETTVQAPQPQDVATIQDSQSQDVANVQALKLAKQYNQSEPDNPKQIKIVGEVEKNIQYKYINQTEGNMNNLEQLSIDTNLQNSNNTHKENKTETPVLNNQDISNSLINKSLGKLPFPLEIAYRPRILKNMTKKKIEVEPRADGYIGCFIDHLVQGRDLPVRAGIPMVVPMDCRNACKKTGYKYAGLQYGYLCFCGNNYGKYDIVPDSECNTVCSGNESFSCGGLWRNEIFDTEHVTGIYEGKVPYYMPPKQRSSMDEVPGSVKSEIPLTPSSMEYEDKKGDELLNEMQYSEYADIKALENMKNDAIRRSNIGNVVRNVGNYTDEDLINAAALELTLNHAAKNDATLINHSPDLNPVPSSAAELLPNEDNNQDEKALESFTYLHPQNINTDEPKHSPIMPLKIEPGTHLFRGELMLQQPWYDDLAKPDSTKYKILSGNIEVALKNVFANDASFLKAEVMSLSEDDKGTPHKTTADFTMTFLQDQPTETVTHKLMDSVLNTKHLDEMPVVPHSLKVKEYLHDSDAQAYIPKMVDGKLHLDTSSPINLKYNSENKILNDKNYANQQHEPKTTMSLNSAFQRMLQPPQVASSNPNNYISQMPSPQSAPLNPVVQTHIRPVGTDGMTELKNYMSEQTVTENAGQRNIVNLPPVLPSAEQKIASNLASKSTKRKVPYVLRMFFWKDMLARKKRESNMDELEKYKTKAKKQKIIHFTKGLPIIREKRSQADEWPTVYKKDDQKRSYNSKTLKRKKRVLDDEDILEQEKDNDEYELLFNKKTIREVHSNEPFVKNTKEQREKRSNNIMKKELISDSVIKGLDDDISEERVSSRNKRNHTVDVDEDET